MKTQWVLALGALLVTAILVALWWTSGEPETRLEQGAPAGPAPSAAPVQASDGVQDLEDAPPTARSDAPVSAKGAPPPATQPRVTPLPPEQWPERIRPGPPRVIATPAPEAGLPVRKEEIREAIDVVKPLIARCFNDAAVRNPGDQKVVLKFTITGQGLRGRFQDGEVVESSIVDPWVQACFLEAMVDAEFPPPTGGGTVTVTYPFSYVVTDAGE